MTPEEHQLLVETRQLAQQNAEILAEMQRAAKKARTMRVIYWTIIIVISVGSLFLIGPLTSSLQGQLNGMSDTSGF